MSATQSSSPTTAATAVSTRSTSRRSGTTTTAPRPPARVAATAWATAAGQSCSGGRPGSAVQAATGASPDRSRRSRAGPAG
ncbi:hypothetical protein [Ornithinimicrobium sp. W1665]|uniref:hypothetical protein n=1 Tax=Ornithinimicrobium sp. W1665 TaxID=3416666 RepID=UPI003D6C21C2